MIAAWVTTELASLELGDKRRERRAGRMVDQLAQICESQPDAAKSKAALKANYRFIHHPENSPEAILDAHNQASIQRTSEHDWVVLAQDTTTIDLTKPHRQVQGAGLLESDDKRGVFLHPLYAMTGEGLPLGIVDQVIWTRDKINTDLTKSEKERLRKQAAFEEKESSRWLEMFQSGEQIARANPATNYTVVGDSESDICEIYAEVGDLPENCHFVIRGCQNRAVIDCGDAANVDEALAAAEIQFTSQVNMSERVSKIAGETRPRRKSRSARVAEIGVRAREITIRGPARPGGKLPDMTLNVVEAVELDPPAGEEPIRWLLFTTLSIDSIAQIQRVISAYSIRWNIETNHAHYVQRFTFSQEDKSDYIGNQGVLDLAQWRQQCQRETPGEEPCPASRMTESPPRQTPASPTIRLKKLWPSLPESNRQGVLQGLGQLLQRQLESPPAGKETSDERA